jgi:hypothetical protein
VRLYQLATDAVALAVKQPWRWHGHASPSGLPPGPDQV